MMGKTAIRLPAAAYPKKDLENPCDCQNKPIDLTFKSGLLFWELDEGALVRAEDFVAALEVEKKTVMIPAGADGRLAEHCVADGDEVDSDAILGYIEEV
mgnify:CR=1 FL=1